MSSISFIARIRRKLIGPQPSETYGQLRVGLAKLDWGYRMGVQTAQPGEMAAGLRGCRLLVIIPRSLSNSTSV